MHAKRLAGSAKIMKKTLVRKKRPSDEETLSSEYRFDYSKSQPNRFAAKMSKGTVAVVLEPDVAKIFRSSEVVNASALHNCNDAEVETRSASQPNDMRSAATRFQITPQEK